MAFETGLDIFRLAYFESSSGIQTVQNSRNLTTFMKELLKHYGKACQTLEKKNLQLFTDMSGNQSN